MNFELIMVRKSRLSCDAMILEVCFDSIFGIVMLFG